MQYHTLKTHPEPFQAVLDGIKNFEYRFNDRDYQVGDVLDLREYNPITNEFSGRTIHVEVTYMLEDGYGLPKNYVILGIKRFERWKDF